MPELQSLRGQDEEETKGIADPLAELIDDAGKVVSEAFQSYIGWFIVQLALDALFPQVALIINVAFILFTVIGLLAGVDEILEAPTITVFALSLLSLGINIWLVVNVG